MVRRALLLVVALALVGCGGSVEGSPDEASPDGLDIRDATNEAVGAGDSADATNLFGETGPADATLPPRPDGSLETGGPTTLRWLVFPGCALRTINVSRGLLQQHRRMHLAGDQLSLRRPRGAVRGVCGGRKLLRWLRVRDHAMDMRAVKLRGCCIGNVSSGDEPNTQCFPGTEGEFCGRGGAGCGIAVLARPASRSGLTRADSVKRTTAARPRTALAVASATCARRATRPLPVGMVARPARAAATAVSVNPATARAVLRSSRLVGTTDRCPASTRCPLRQGRRTLGPRPRGRDGRRLRRDAVPRPPKGVCPRRDASRDRPEWSGHPRGVAPRWPEPSRPRRRSPAVDGDLPPFTADCSLSTGKLLSLTRECRYS